MKSSMLRPAGVVAMLAVPLILVAGVAAARDCPYKNQPVSQVVKKNVGVFTSAGKWLRDVAGVDITTGTLVLDCNEDLGIVKIKLGSETAWVDRLALNLKPAGAHECIAKPVTRTNGQTEPVSSGIGEGCATTPAAK
jgi:hypothetical protein